MLKTQSQGEAAIRRAGAVAALAAASVLMATMGFPAVQVEARADVVLALHAILLLGCAAVLLSPAHGAVADLITRRATTEAGRATVLTASARAPAGSLRWLGFAGIALYVAGDVAAPNEAEVASLETVKDFLLFMMFLAGVWAVYLSMGSLRAAPPPRSLAAVAEEDPDDEEVNIMAPARVVVDSKV